MATAYDQYAVEAFRWEALDYLLKPVEKDRLARGRSNGRAKASRSDRKRRQPEPPPPKPSLQRTKMLIKSNHRNFIVDAQDVVYATIDDGLITVVATNLEGQSNYRTIEELQSNLDPDMFWRVHRSFLVNIHRIREVIPWFKSSFQLRMDDKKQTEIPVSRVQTKTTAGAAETLNREYHKWFSPALGREMELLVFGHGGSPLVVFPTSMGRFFDYENRHMIDAVGDV